MDRKALIEKVNSTLAYEFEKNIEEIHEDGDLRLTLALDSLSLVDMVAVIDHYFGIRIANADLVNIRTFEHLYDYLIAKGALEKD